MPGVFGDIFGGTVLAGGSFPAEPGAPPVAPGEHPPTVEGEGFSTDFAAQMYGELEPAAVPDPANNYALAAVCDAYGSMYRQVEETVRAKDGFDGQTQTWNVDRVPDFLLAFFGQHVGVEVTRGLTPDEQRQQIREGRSHKRGKPDQMMGDIRETLTGSKRVRLVERTNENSWTATVVTSPAETPSTTATEKAGNGSKPYGIVLTYVLSSLPIIDEGTRNIDAATGTIDAATLANVT